MYVCVCQLEKRGKQRDHTSINTVINTDETMYFIQHITATIFSSTKLEQEAVSTIDEQ